MRSLTSLGGDDQELEVLADVTPKLVYLWLTGEIGQTKLTEARIGIVEVLAGKGDLIAKTKRGQSANDHDADTSVTVSQIGSQNA